MSVTAGVWVVAALVLLLLSLRRSAWAVALYMLPFFAAPHLWWWGDDLPSLRYSFISGFVLAAAVVFHRSLLTEDVGRRFTVTHFAAIGMVINATLVHFFIASTPSISIIDYIELVKFVLLFFLMWSAIQDKRDLRLVLIAIALGAAYIGYEVTINERGDFTGSRLEGVGAPAADTSNGLACLMLVTIPLSGSLFVDGKWRSRLVAVVSTPLALNVLLLCNSRGAFLGLVGAAVVFLLIARGATRKRAFQTLALGAVTLFLLLGDPRIVDRFMTTFVGSEERDNSAGGRLLLWESGLLMLSDYPLGDGGGAYKFIHGARYLAKVSDIDEYRSIHNGYLTEATSWGVQGLFLHLLFFGTAMVAAYRTSKRCRLEGNLDGSMTGNCLIVAGAGLLIACMFGSFLANEWVYWTLALLVRYSELYRTADAVSKSTAVDATPAARVTAGLPVASRPLVAHRGSA